MSIRIVEVDKDDDAQPCPYCSRMTEDPYGGPCASCWRAVDDMYPEAEEWPQP